jgi:hypothetical protein
MGGTCSTYGGGVYRILVENLRGSDHLEGADVRIILRWIFSKWDVGVRTGSIWLRIGIGGRHL